MRITDQPMREKLCSKIYKNRLYQVSRDVKTRNQIKVKNDLKINLQRMSDYAIN